MITKKIIICVGGTHFITPKLELSVYSYEALQINGKRRAKMLVQRLKTIGLFKITLVEL